MASPQTDAWWATFLDLHGRDSEEEAGFLGYLVTKGVPASAPPDQLQSTYTDFVAFVDTSRETANADPGPDAPELASRNARVALANVAVPRSRTADPLVQKPYFAATRPPELRRDPAEAPVPQFAEGTPIPNPQPIPGTPPRGPGVPGPQPPTEPPGPGPQPGDPPKPPDPPPADPPEHEPQPGLRRR